MPADQHRLGRGLEQHAVARREGRKHAAGRDRQREVPRWRDDHHAERLHAAAGEIISGELDGPRVVAGEVDCLGDLGIRLQHRLGAVHDHGADEIAAPAGQHRRRLIQQGAPGRPRLPGPRGKRGAGRVESAAHLLAVGQGVTIGHALRSRAIAVLDLAGARHELAVDLERHRFRRPIAPVSNRPLDPLAVGGNGPVRVRLVRERERAGDGRIVEGRSDLGRAVLPLAGSVRQLVHELEGGQEAIPLAHPVG